MDYSLPGSCVHGILQARILEWVARPSSKGSSQPRDQTQVSHIADRFFTVWATREALKGLILVFYPQAGVELRVERILPRAHSDKCGQGAPTWCGPACEQSHMGPPGEV